MWAELVQLSSDAERSYILHLTSYILHLTSYNSPPTPRAHLLLGEHPLQHLRAEVLHVLAHERLLVEPDVARQQLVGVLRNEWWE